MGCCNCNNKDDASNFTINFTTPKNKREKKRHSSYIENERAALPKACDELTKIPSSVYPCISSSSSPFLPTNSQLPPQISENINLNGQSDMKNAKENADELGYMSKYLCAAQIPNVTVEIVDEAQIEETTQHDEMKYFSEHSQESTEMINKTSKCLFPKTFEVLVAENGEMRKRRYSFDKWSAEKKMGGENHEKKKMGGENHEKKRKKIQPGTKGIISTNMNTKSRNFSPESTLSKDASFDTIKHATLKMDCQKKQNGDHKHTSLSKSSTIEKISQKKGKDFLSKNAEIFGSESNERNRNININRYGNGNGKIFKCKDLFEEDLGACSTKNLVRHGRLSEYRYNQTKAGSTSNVNMAFNPSTNPALSKYLHLFTDTCNYPRGKHESNRHFVKNSWDTEGDITNLRSRLMTVNGHTTGDYSGHQSDENSLAVGSNLHTVPNLTEDNNNNHANFNSISIVQCSNLI